MFHQAAEPDLICFSHLRWNFVFQRPQHLMLRCARERRVFFFEEPIRESGIESHVRLESVNGVTVVVPYLDEALAANDVAIQLRLLLAQFMRRERINEYVLWYFTPMALSFTRHLVPHAIVYDCMDELSAFKGAPQALGLLDEELMRCASLVLTGGQSLYEARHHRHPNVHPVPSSVDVDHFAQARRLTVDPSDQRDIPHPRLGFFGVVDERMDLALLEGMADARPDWHVIIVGPVVKIDPASLPTRANIHYLGSKLYEELPHYIAQWDVALMPFARNDATRFISPTKTPEYMAAGKPIVSTSIRDVVRPYGQQGLVRIADDVEMFVAACAASMAENPAARRRDADAFLRHTSWDGTWNRIRAMLNQAIDPDVSANGSAIDSATAV
jgi:UDP-galactopyranose mutase